MIKTKCDVCIDSSGVVSTGSELDVCKFCSGTGWRKPAKRPTRNAIVTPADVVELKSFKTTPEEGK